MAFILAVDHGTTRTKALLVDERGQVRAEHACELPQLYPRPGWVEHSPNAIWEVTRAAIRGCLQAAGARPSDLAGLALANQGETVVCWDRQTGRPVYNAIVWQDRRTAERCRELAPDWRETVYRKTGLLLDPYFSATKIEWILRHVPEARELARQGRLAVGTTDAWLVWQLTGGRSLLTDPSTASRTMLWNLEAGAWDGELLDLFGIRREWLPDVVPSVGRAAVTAPDVLGAAIPVVALAVDQQAALFGHGCIRPGMAKATYGTGAFILMQTGERPAFGSGEVLTTVAWRIGERTSFALDGGIFTAGAAVQWLRDGLGVLAAPEESERLALEVADTGGVYAVPAFAGLAAPHWDPDARAAILGITRGTTRAHIVRAFLEGIAFRVRDVVEAMARQAGAFPPVLRADGGPTANGFLMQFQADILGIPVETASVREATAYGAALMGGIALAWWGEDEPERRWTCARRYEPRMSGDEREERYRGWLRAVERARGWAR